ACSSEPPTLRTSIGQACETYESVSGSNQTVASYWIFFAETAVTDIAVRTRLSALFGPQARHPFAGFDFLAAPGDQERATARPDGLGVDDALGDVVAGGNLVHDVEKGVLEDRAEAAGAGLVADGLFCRRLERVLGEDELDAVECEELLELADDG